MNIMRQAKLLMAFLIACVLIVLAGCSSEEKKETSVDTKAQPLDKPLLTEKDSLEAMLNEALVRLSYGDKSGLYGLEFEYLHDEFDFDGYLKMRELAYAQMDTLDHMELHSLVKEGEDSALAKISYVFKGASGKVTEVPDEFYVYKEYGKWKKPTASKYAEQLKYEKRMREAREAVEDEE